MARRSDKAFKDGAWLAGKLDELGLTKDVFIALTGYERRTVNKWLAHPEAPVPHGVVSFLDLWVHTTDEGRLAYALERGVRLSLTVR